MNTVGYVSVTGNEETEHPDAIAAQEALVEEFARRAGLELVKVYKDTGLGRGARAAATRGGLIQLLDDSTNGSFTTILVSERRRIRRDEEVDFDVCGELRELGKQLIVIAETPDPRPIAAAVKRAAVEAAAVAAAQAEANAGRDWSDEKGTASQRSCGALGTVDGRRTDGRGEKTRAKRSLRAQSGPAPYGYYREPVDGRRGRSRLVLEPREAEVVRLIFREYLRKRSMKKLIEFLEGRSITTRRGRRWSRAAIAWILKNDTYLGKVHAGGDRYRGTHEPIIAPIIFNKVQQLLRKNNKRKNEPKTPKKAKTPAAAAIEKAKAPKPATETETVSPRTPSGRLQLSAV